MEDDEKGVKGNTSPVHKPADAKQYDVAPAGSVGTQVLMPSFSPGGTTRTVHVTMTFGDTEHTQEEIEPEHKGPISIETGDAEVDVDSISKGDRVLSMEEIKEEAAAMSRDANESRPQGGESAYAQAFKKAHGNAQEHQQSKDTELE